MPLESPQIKTICRNALDQINLVYLSLKADLGEACYFWGSLESAIPLQPEDADRRDNLSSYTPESLDECVRIDNAVWELEHELLRPLQRRYGPYLLQRLQRLQGYFTEAHIDAAKCLAIESATEHAAQLSGVVGQLLTEHPDMPREELIDEMTKTFTVLLLHRYEDDFDGVLNPDYDPDRGYVLSDEDEAEALPENTE